MTTSRMSARAFFVFASMTAAGGAAPAIAACGSSQAAPGLAADNGDDDDASTSSNGTNPGPTGTTSNDGDAGEPGDGSYEIRDASSIVYAPFDAAIVTTKQIAAHVCDSYVVSPSTGTLEAWGCYGYGVPEAFVENNPDGAATSVPVDPPSPTPRPVVDSSPGWTDVGGDCAVRADHSLWCWGTNAASKYAQNGGTIAPSNASGDAGRVADLAPGMLGGSWVSVTTNLVVSCGIQTNGSGWCWGQNDEGSRGIGIFPGSSGPGVALPTLLDVPDGTQWRSLSAGWMHACGVQVDGSLWCWGLNANGQLGLDVGGPLDKPTPVGTSSAWENVSAGTYTTCASRGADVYCWGNTKPSGEIIKPSGDLPFGALLFAHTTASGWSHVSTNGMGTCAVDRAGMLWCADGIAPGTAVMTDVSWSDVVVDGLHACALTTTGLVRCWGENYEAALGPNGGAIQASELAETMSMSIPNAVDVGTF